MVLIACLIIRICYSVGNIMRERRYSVATGAGMASLLKIKSVGSMSSMIQSSIVIEKQRGVNEQCSVRLEVPGEKNVKASRNLQTRQTLEEQDKKSKDESYWEMKVTKSLLVVSTVFLCLHLPLHTIRCAQFITVRFIQTIPCTWSLWHFLLYLFWNVQLFPWDWI